MRPGPKRTTIPADKLPLITKMTADGKRERAIQLALGMSQPTWAKCKRDFPEVADALARGQEAFYDRIIGNLLRLADKGNLVANIFLSKVLLGLRENDEPADMRPQITINLPGAATNVEQYARGVTIDATPTTSQLLSVAGLKRKDLIRG